MASIYRFTKKEDPKSTAQEPSENARQFDPSLIMGEDLPQPVSQPKEDPKHDTREIPVPGDTAEKEIHTEEAHGEKTRAFDPSAIVPEEEAKGKEPSAPTAPRKSGVGNNVDIEELLNLEDTRPAPPPEELLRALSEQPEIDGKKFDEVFGHPAKRSDEEDVAAAILREMLGGGPEKKKSKASDAPVSEEDLLGQTKTLDEALASLQKENDSYVAVHNGEDETTKEYRGTFSLEDLEGVVGNLTPEEGERTVPPLAEEVRVPDAENLYQDVYEEAEEEHHEKKSVLPEEFTTQVEFDEFAEHLRNRNFKTFATVGWSFLFFLAVLYLESATFSNLYHPEFLSPYGIYNVIFLLVDIQLVLFSAIFVLPSLLKGAKGLFTGKPNRGSVPFLSVLSTLVHTGILLATDASEYPLFGCVSAFFCWLLALSDFLDAKRRHRTFRIFGKNQEKLVAVPVGEESAEAEAFRDQLDGSPIFYSVQKAGFADGFFREVDRPSKAESAFGWMAVLGLLFALGFAGYSYWKSPDLVLAANRFMSMAMMAFPLSSVFMVVLPFSHLSRKAEKRSCAILSAKGAEDLAAADVVSFTDKEIFPPKSVKVTTIRTYGKTRIDKAILYSAMIFQKLGGPLSLVFKKTISGVYSEIPENFDFLEITADGMCAKIEGKDVFVGNKNYLLSYDFGYTKDAVDENFEQHSGKIMYMVIGSELAAKFYIRYSISKRFKKTILSLFKCGICPAVKTCDPNIDADLFRTLLQNDKIPAGIIKTCEAMKDAPVTERTESALVCNSTIANLLYGFSLCESLRHVIRTNAFIKILSALLGAGIVVFLFFIGSMTKITGLFVLIYQILWMIPVIIPSLTE